MTPCRLPAVLARARFKGERKLSAYELTDLLRAAYRDCVEQEARRIRVRLRDEQRAIDLGHEALSQYMRDAQHAANSAQIRRAATVAAKAIGTKHYRLITQYFAAGYFSTRQALQLDALRYAIDLADLSEADRDWALAAWLGTAATLVNAPGHTAQYLKPNNDHAYRRIRTRWIRSTWDAFQNELVALSQLVLTNGEAESRRSKRRPESSKEQ